MTELVSSALLDDAAACLIAVAHADPSLAPAAVRLPCLWAVELLRSAGAETTGSGAPAAAVDVCGRIREGLALLGMLPFETFAEHAVLEAVAAARAALDAAG